MLVRVHFSQGIITLVSPAYVHRSIKWWPHYRRSHDGLVSFRTQSGERRIRNSDRPVNPGFATPLLHYADDLHRHRLRRQAIFLLLLTLHKLFIMQHFFYSYYYYYPRSALFFVHRKMIQPDNILWRNLGWTGGFVNTSLPHAGDFGITLPSCIDRAMSPLRSAELLAPPPRDRLGGWNLAPHQARTASSIPNTLTS